MKKVRILLVCLTIFCLHSSYAQTKVILKLDDFIVKNNLCTGGSTLDYILSKKIKATIGAVSTKFDASALSVLAPYLNATNLNNEKLLEVWHHGFDHINPEFSGTSYAYQKWHFDSADVVMKNYLRLQMRSFGAPYNHNDTISNRVIEENGNYKVTMFNDPAPSSAVLNLTNRVNMENGTGNPEYNYFLTNYNLYKTSYTNYMVLQGHPYLWGATELAQFTQIIDFLISENCVFVTPYEYYLSLNPSTPQPTTPQTITFNSLSNKIVGDADYSPGATASSGLSVEYNSSNTNVATIVNGNIHIVGAGTTIITASQMGNSIYMPANYVSQTLIVNAIDYRSSTTGTWGTATSWEVRDALGNWSIASSIPSSLNNVYIQNGHTITVDIANAYCNDLHFNTSGVLAIGNNIVNVSGKIRAYTGSAVIGSSISDGSFYSGQTSTTTLASAMVTTSTNGLLKFIGGTRNITNTGEWTGSGTTNYVEFALNADAIGTLSTAIKFRTITISSGNIVIGNSSINVGSSTGNGNLIIKNGARLTSSRNWTGTAGSQAITYNSATKMGTLQIDNGAVLEFKGASTAFDCTTLTNNGTIIYSGNNQNLATNSAATNVSVGSVLPSTYNHLIVEGTGTKTLATNITIAGVLSVDAGTLSTGSNNLTLNGSAIFASGTTFSINGGVTDFTGKSVTLQSSVSASSSSDNASITTITGTLNNANNVTIQQYIPGGFRKYRFLAHPFTTAIPLSQLTDNIDITGTGGGVNGFTSTTTNNPSAYYFNTANANGNVSLDGGWTPFTSANTASWQNGKGIIVLVRGSKNQTNSLTGGAYTPNEVVLDMVGSINTGNVNIALSDAGTGASQGFNLVGNPYPSAVDIGAVLTAASNISGNSFYVRNPQIGSYSTVNPIPASYILPANSSFFVKVSAPTTLNFTEANKTICTSCPSVFRNTLKSFVQIKAFKNGTEYDNLQIGLDDTYSEKYEQQVDAIKLINDELSIFSLASNNEKLAADYRSISNTTSIPLGITLPNSFGKQKYQLIVSDCNLLMGVKLFLFDKLSNHYTEIKKGISYELSIDPSNTATQGNDRLKIIVQKEASSVQVGNDQSLFSANISTTSSGVVVHYQAATIEETSIFLYDNNGKLLQQKKLGLQQSGQHLLQVNHLPKGMYLVEVVMGKQRITKKLIR